MKCPSPCFPLGIRCGWDCCATSTQTSEMGPRLNETEKDGYFIISDSKLNSGQNNVIGDKSGRE